MKVTLVSYSFLEYICLAPYYLKGYAETNSVIKSNCDITVMDLNSSKYRNKFGRLDSEGSDEEIFMTSEFLNKTGKTWGDSKRLIELILATDPDILGFNCYVWNINFILFLCKEIKELKPDVVIILGGPEFGYCNDEQYLKENKNIDYICCGEGEATFQEFLLCLIHKDNLDKVNGISFLRNNKIVRAWPRTAFEDLTPIPSPYLTGMINIEEEKHRYIPLETYRGCPFLCTFCDYPKNYGAIIHPFSMERVENDIKFILSHDIENMYFLDATFNLPKQRSKEILRKIIKYKSPNVNFKLEGEIRGDLIRTDYMELMIDAGWRSLEMGIQSVNLDTLRAIKRPQKMKAFIENSNFWKSRGLNLVTNLILGLPKETYDTYIDALNFCVGIYADRIVTNFLHVLPNTPLWTEAEKLGIEYNNHAPWTVIQTPDFPKGELEKAWDFYCDFAWAYNKRPRPLESGESLHKTYCFGDFVISPDRNYPWAR